MNQELLFSLALALTKVFLCGAVFLQHLENLKLISRPRLNRGILQDGIYRLILIAGLAACVLWPLGLLFSAGFEFELGCALLIVCSLLAVSMSFGGSFNGGADAMSLQISLAMLFSFLGKAALLYIGVQLILSYFVAGLVKVKNPEWRNGLALQELTQSGHYEIPESARRFLAKDPTRSKVLGWTVMIFEIGFPLFFMNPKLAIVGLVLAFGFHLANFWVLGLNRFIWAWLAAYPAALYLSFVI